MLNAFKVSRSAFRLSERVNASIFSNNACFKAKFAFSSLLRSANWAFLALKNTSWAERKRFQSLCSSPGAQGPAAFQACCNRIMASDVAFQSVLD